MHIVLQKAWTSYCQCGRGGPDGEAAVDSRMPIVLRRDRLEVAGDARCEATLQGFLPTLGSSCEFCSQGLSLDANKRMLLGSWRIRGRGGWTP
jgi:hypothetical protein